LFPRCSRRYRRLAVDLVHNRKVGGKVCQEHVASLGTVLDTDPLDPVECAKYWGRLDQRLRALRERHPDRISESDEVKIRASVSRYIPPPEEAEA
jgi:hypothetical protein